MMMVMISLGTEWMRDDVGVSVLERAGESETKGVEYLLGEYSQSYVRECYEFIRNSSIIVESDCSCSTLADKGLRRGE
jgi:hypothetical protein